MSDKKTGNTQERLAPIIQRDLGPMAHDDAMDLASTLIALGRRIEAECGDDFEMALLSFNEAMTLSDSDMRRLLFIASPIGPPVFATFRASPSLPFEKRCELQARLDIYVAREGRQK